MRIPTKLAATTAALALGFASAALANGPSGTHGKSQSAPGHTRTQQTSSTGSTSTTTTTSANRSATNPARTCAKESKKHVAGQPGTPYSRCVKAAAKTRGEHNGSSTTTTTTTTTTT